MVWIIAVDANIVLEMVWIMTLDAKILVWILGVDYSTKISVWNMIADDENFGMNYNCWAYEL